MPWPHRSNHPRRVRGAAAVAPVLSANSAVFLAVYAAFFSGGDLSRVGIAHVPFPALVLEIFLAAYLRTSLSFAKIPVHRVLVGQSQVERNG